MISSRNGTRWCSWNGATFVAYIVLKAAVSFCCCCCCYCLVDGCGGGGGGGARKLTARMQMYVTCNRVIIYSFFPLFVPFVIEHATNTCFSSCLCYHRIEAKNCFLPLCANATPTKVIDSGQYYAVGKWPANQSRDVNELCNPRTLGTLLVVREKR